MPSVLFVNSGHRVPLGEGKTILDAVRTAQLPLESPCGGLGVCGKCRVRLVREGQANPARNLVNMDKRRLVSAEDLEQGYVLACRALVTGDLELVLPGDQEAENQSLVILDRGESFDYALRPFITKRLEAAGACTAVYGGGELLGREEGDTRGELYGIALDIGTTTLVAELIDLRNGAVLAKDAMLNPQSAYAQDVLSRIHLAASREGGLDLLHQAFLEAFRQLLGNLSASGGVEPRRIYEVVFSGNTTMLHLATGTDPAPLGKYPYLSTIAGGEYRPAGELGIAPFALVYLPPLVSAYVGADICSGILVSRLDQKKGTTLFIDIGTNGEMVLAKDGRLSATSTAAGPAFEGMNISCGMRAAKGAIEGFRINDGTELLDCQVIGGGPARGICGSGLLDIVGELARTGVVGKNGRFAKAEALPPALAERLERRADEAVFVISAEVSVSQKDIRQVQLAKGAIRAGLEALLDRIGTSAGDLDRVEIAGSFGYHLREESLFNIGLLPPGFRGKIRFTGNTSQSGAAAFLLNAEFRETMKDLAGRVEKVELADTGDFERRFVQSLQFPSPEGRSAAG
ncbi:MAG: ASKHA domain-containing protein [Treponema sp.]|jgi:uncharacterized 2Fe-2S/4Fe-4S cluster protein (DUF4445 family)|nr:ASKHA domain-containing protein [Treponema sp.]